MERFKFRELTFIVAVAGGQGETEQGGFYLAHAFHSLRLFAFAERAFFKTPYFPGDVRVTATPGASIELRINEQCHFEAIIPESRVASSVTFEEWKGTVFLPHDPSKQRELGPKFFAVLSGELETYPFVESDDRVCIAPAKPFPILGWLVDSEFTGRQWCIRRSARHAKSKTYPRDVVFAEE